MCAGAVVSDPHDDVGVVGGDVVGSPPTHAPLWNEKRVENSEGEREREMMMMMCVYCNIIMCPLFFSALGGGVIEMVGS